MVSSKSTYKEEEADASGPRAINRWPHSPGCCPRAPTELNTQTLPRYPTGCGLQRPTPLLSPLSSGILPSCTLEREEQEAWGEFS